MSKQKIQDTTIQETILDQLMQTKVHGFPFFAYTGIKDYVMASDDTLILHLPENPKGLDNINVVYDFGMDVYKLYAFKGGVPLESKMEVYFDELGELITKYMGVY